ncbi:MAG: hypothetical protein U0167_17055 [bacterium]
MLRRRFGAAFALFILLAGPLGLLAAEHGAFHHPGAADEHGAPCPVCQFLSTTSIEAPLPAAYLPVLVLVHDEPSVQVTTPAAAPTFAPRQSRAPPSLLS